METELDKLINIYINKKKNLNIFDLIKKIYDINCKVQYNINSFKKLKEIIEKDDTNKFTLLISLLNKIINLYEKFLFNKEINITKNIINTNDFLILFINSINDINFIYTEEQLKNLLVDFYENYFILLYNNIIKLSNNIDINIENDIKKIEEYSLIIEKILLLNSSRNTNPENTNPESIFNNKLLFNGISKLKHISEVSNEKIINTLLDAKLGGKKNKKLKKYKNIKK